uniref:Complement factor properdin n=1 Tax=Salarias fasciatus TaxID=181472 RepID=A0A672FNX1_SALFA
METRGLLKVLVPVPVLVLVLVLVPVRRSGESDGVRCFAHFNVTSGVCDEELGEVGKDSCCQNPAYGYLATDGVCQFCGPSVWSPWSSWSPCNVLCGDGVRQRRMKCFSINQSECENDRLQTEPCTGWRPWTDWSHCSVTCGGLGLRKRERVCSSSPECLSSCSGPSEETQACEVTSACPVHGGWSLWSGWSSCSASCIDDRRRGVPVPTRQRRRSCSDPAPSTDTPVPGNRCPGDDSELQDCSELPNCPVDGHWGAWSPPGPCSVTCGAGLQLSNRKCDSPTPKHGGRYCEGQSSQTSVCESPCPVDGFWSGWTVWTECSSPCVPDAGASVRIRRRSCTNPAPSANPPGGGCHGDDSQREDCVQLPPCPVDGAWGSWSEFSPCPVTCGFGRQTRERFCLHRDHGGAICSGDLQDRRHCYDVQGCLGESSLTSDLRTQTP